jgi:hypothetical protein
MADTIIRSLAILRSRLMDQHDAVDHIPGGDWADQEKLWASRSWSRQCDGLASAMMAEAPTCVADVLSVLLVAQEKFEADVIMEDDVPANSRASRTCEQIRIVLANCTVALAAAVPTLTPMELQMVQCSRKEREWWLPTAVAPADRAESAA